MRKISTDENRCMGEVRKKGKESAEC